MKDDEDFNDIKNKLQHLIESNQAEIDLLFDGIADEFILSIETSDGKSFKLIDSISMGMVRILMKNF